MTAEEKAYYLWLAKKQAKRYFREKKKCISDVEKKAFKLAARFRIQESRYMIMNREEKERPVLEKALRLYLIRTGLIFG